MSPTRIFPAIALLALAAQAHATEGGASIYPHGVEGCMASTITPAASTTTTATTSTCPISASMPT